MSERDVFKGVRKNSNCNTVPGRNEFEGFLVVFFQIVIPEVTVGNSDIAKGMNGLVGKIRIASTCSCNVQRLPAHLYGLLGPYRSLGGFQTHGKCCMWKLVLYELLSTTWDEHCNGELCKMANLCHNES